VALAEWRLLRAVGITVTSWLALVLLWVTILTVLIGPGEITDTVHSIARVKVITTSHWYTFPILAYVSILTILVSAAFWVKTLVVETLATGHPCAVTVTLTVSWAMCWISWFGCW
jgi:hypothetical protein